MSEKRRCAGSTEEEEKEKEEGEEADKAYILFVLAER